jgi:ligand-binding sensor domain-containing protein/serine phosphatase RsbU (regulator of sigma subunit)
MRKFNFIFLVFFLLVHLLCGQSNFLAPDKPINKYILDHWTTDEGLPANTLVNILQTTDGYIWISSYAGLLRFDGVSFMNFNKENTKVFTANPVDFLYETKQKELLITSDNDGVIRFFKGQFSVLISQKQINAPVQVIAEDQNQNLWLGTQSKGVWLYDRKKNTLTNLSIHKDLENTTINTIKFRNNGEVWIGTEKGLFIKNGEKITFYDNSNEVFYTNYINAIYESSDGKIWVGTGVGVSYFDGKNFIKIPETQYYPVRSITEDASKSIWISTQKGLFRINGLTKNIEFVDDKNSLLPHPDMRNMMLDHEQSLWLTTYRSGLVRFKNGKFIKYTTKDGLVSSVANHVCEWQKNVYLVGTDLGIINTIDNGKVGIFPIKTELPNDKRLKHLLKDSKGNLWVSSYSGLLKIEPNGKEKLYTRQDSLTTVQVRFSFEDSEGTIWIGTRGGGLMSLKNGIVKAYTKKTGFPSDFIMCMQETQNGNLLVGTNESGLIILSKDGKIIKQYTTKDGLPINLVFNIYEDKDQILWLSSSTGITRLDTKTNQVHKYAVKQGLPDENIFDIKEDNFGNLWFTSAKGIIKIAKAHLNEYAKNPKIELNFVLYDKYDGMNNSECTSATTILKTADGTFFFPTLGGVVSISPKEIMTNSMKPPVYTEDVFVDYELFLPDSVLEIPAGKQRFSIDYTALSYIAPPKIHFKYKLEKFDKQWIDAHGERKAVYTNIPPGTYTFKVIASNNDGVWNENGAKLTIVVLPHFWQTRWFWALVILLITLLVVGIYRWQISKVKQRNEELEKLVAQRTSEITQKNTQLVLTNAKLEQQTEEILSQQEVIATNTKQLHLAFSEIQHKNVNITASIQYAKRIQDAMLPVESYIHQYLPESFVFFKPRDIVSGDFYWFSTIVNETNQEIEKLVLAAADCTGHGVPGAFMAMAGNAYLSQIVNLQGYTNPSEILQWLHKSIRNALKQGDSDNRDGMDIAICTIELPTKTILYAGAQNPLIVIRQNPDATHTFEEIKANKTPVGGSWGKNNEDRNFDTQTIVLDDRKIVCYIFSDGFQDQFGGEFNKKFTKKRLYALLDEIYCLPFEEQKEKLENSLTTWQQKEQQLDDILVLGFSV